MYRARDAVEHEAYLEDLEAATAELDLDADVRSTATDLFLTSVPEADRSKRAVLAASLYAGALIAGDGRSQGAVASALGTSRLAVQSHWKDVLRAAGFRPPTW